jgi:hypothetical protein
MFRKRADLSFAIALLALVTWMAWEASHWANGARLFPVVVAIPTIGLALLQVGILLKPSGARDTFAAAADAGSAATPRARGLTMVGWVLAMAVSSAVLGFELAAGLLTFLFLRVACYERVRTSLTIALVAYLTLYALFERALFVPFPPGSLAEVLGLDEPLDHYLLDRFAALIQNQ